MGECGDWAHPIGRLEAGAQYLRAQAKDAGQSLNF